MHALVKETEWLTPSLVRVVLTGGELAAFEMAEATRSVGRSGAATPCAPGTRPRRL